MYAGRARSRHAGHRSIDSGSKRRAFFLAVVLAALPGTAVAHGFIVTPTARTTNDYQIDLGTMPCADYPNPGPIQAVWEPGQAIDVTLDITVQHPNDPNIHFQLCDTPGPLTSACFASGEFATAPDDGLLGPRVLNATLPAGFTCEACVLRLLWDNGFVSCVDVSIQEAALVPAGSPRGLALVMLILLTTAAAAIRREQAGREVDA